MRPSNNLAEEKIDNAETIRFVFFFIQYLYRSPSPHTELLYLYRPETIWVVVNGDFVSYRSAVAVVGGEKNEMTYACLRPVPPNRGGDTFSEI